MSVPPVGDILLTVLAPNIVYHPLHRRGLGSHRAWHCSTRSTGHERLRDVRGTRGIDDNETRGLCEGNGRGDQRVAVPQPGARRALQTARRVQVRER